MIIALLVDLFRFSSQNGRLSLVTHRACILTVAFILWHLDVASSE